MTILVNAGADLDVQDSEGRTPLMVGVLGYDEAAPTIPGIKLLLKNGCDVNIKEEVAGHHLLAYSEGNSHAHVEILPCVPQERCTAADLALLNKKQPCLAVLETHGAMVTSWRDTRGAGASMSPPARCSGALASGN